MFLQCHANCSRTRHLHGSRAGERSAPPLQEIMADGKNVVPDVWEVLDQIKEFSDRVRSGEWRGATGQRITNVVAIGIGGSFLGPLFVHTALRTDQV